MKKTRITTRKRRTKKIFAKKIKRKEKLEIEKHKLFIVQRTITQIEICEFWVNILLNIRQPFSADMKASRIKELSCA